MSVNRPTCSYLSSRSPLRLGLSKTASNPANDRCLASTPSIAPLPTSTNRPSIVWSHIPADLPRHQWIIPLLTKSARKPRDTTHRSSPTF